MLAESHLYESLESNAFSTTGEAMCIYGDPTYPLRIHLQAPFRNRVLTRTAVEWLFGGRYQLFQMFRLSKEVKNWS